MASQHSPAAEATDADEKHGATEVSVKSEEAKITQVEELAEKLGDRQDGIAPVGDVALVIDKVESLTVGECQNIIKELLKEHEHDYNFSTTQREKLRQLLNGPQDGQAVDDWELQLKTETAINKFYSPYPEVRAVASPVPDTEVICETIRAHLLGYFWAAVSQFVNSLFNSRFPNVYITSAVAQVLLYPCGKTLALILPDWGFTVSGNRVSLNPGPWTYKEQMLSTIIFNVSVTSAYCFWNIQSQEIYYGDTWLTPAYKILLLISTQIMGLGFAGLLRRYAVFPKFAIWPTILPTVALNRALLVPQKTERINGWTMSRYKFFFIVFGSMFVYFWLPGFIFPALSYFSWMTWIAPSNFKLAVVTGSQFGLGFNPISTFDWNVLSQLTYPLSWPFFSFAQQYAGTVIGGFVILGLYFSNSKWSAYLPPNSSGIFDNKGLTYNVTRVVQDGVLNEAAYKAYSPAFQSAGKLVAYGAFFTYYPFTMVFVFLDTWTQLAGAFRATGKSAYRQVKRTASSTAKACSALAKGNFRESWCHLSESIKDPYSIYEGFDDPFTQLMRNYPEVPDWWFLLVVLVAFVFGIVILAVYKELSTPVWTIFFVIALNLVFLIPMTYIYAVAGVNVGLNVVTELVIGYALPGHPEALMFVKAYGYMINGQADTFTSDLKMGFYAQVPPRAMFRGQLISAILTAFVAYGVVQFVDNDIPGICTDEQASSFTCANGSLVFYAASVLYGAIGPQKLFDQLYPELKYCFLLGFLLALVWWSVKTFGSYIRAFGQRTLPAIVYRPLNTLVFVPLSWLKHVHPSVVLAGFIFWSPTNLSYLTSGLYLSIFFMFYLRRYKTAWFEKYNYVLSAGLTAGVAFSAVIIFFAVQYHPQTVSWWGVNVITEGVDGGSGQNALITTLPEVGYFGPQSWS